MKLQKLLEMMGELDKPGHVSSFAIMFYHPGEYFHKISAEEWDKVQHAQTLLDIYVFTTEQALTETVKAMYSDYLDMLGQDRTEIPDMHDDPEVQKKLADRLGKKKSFKDMTLAELKKLPDWSDFSESFTIINHLL